MLFFTINAHALAATIRLRVRLPLTIHGHNQSRPWPFRTWRQRNHTFYIIFHRPAMRLRVTTHVPKHSGFQISTVTEPLENKLYHAFTRALVRGSRGKSIIKTAKIKKNMVFFLSLNNRGMPVSLSLSTSVHYSGKASSR